MCPSVFSVCVLSLYDCVSVLNLSKYDLGKCVQAALCVGVLFVNKCILVIDVFL